MLCFRLTGSDTQARHEIIKDRKDSRLPPKTRRERAEDGNRGGDGQNGNVEPVEFLPPVVPPNGRKRLGRLERVLDVVPWRLGVIGERALFQLWRERRGERCDLWRGRPAVRLWGRWGDVGHFFPSVIIQDFFAEWGSLVRERERERRQRRQRRQAYDVSFVEDDVE